MTLASSSTKNLRQMHLDFGQKNIGLITCSKCGMVYQHEEEDEKTHKKHCQSNMISQQRQKELEEINELMKTVPAAALDLALRRFLSTASLLLASSIVHHQTSTSIKAPSVKTHHHNTRKMMNSSFRQSSSSMMIKTIEIQDPFMTQNYIGRTNNDTHKDRISILTSTADAIFTILASIQKNPSDESSFSSSLSSSKLYSQFLLDATKMREDVGKYTTYDAQGTINWMQNLSLVFVVMSSASSSCTSSTDHDFDFDKIIGVSLFHRFSRFVATEIVDDTDYEQYSDELYNNNNNNNNSAKAAVLDNNKDNADDENGQITFDSDELQQQEKRKSTMTVDDDLEEDDDEPCARIPDAEMKNNNNNNTTNICNNNNSKKDGNKSESIEDWGEDMMDNFSRNHKVTTVRGTTTHGIIYDLMTIPPYQNHYQQQRSNNTATSSSSTSSGSAKPQQQQKSVASFFGGGSSSSVASLGSILSSSKSNNTNNNKTTKSSSSSSSKAIAKPATASFSSFFKPKQQEAPKIRQRDEEENDDNKNNDELFLSTILHSLCHVVQVSDSKTFLSKRVTFPFAFSKHLVILTNEDDDEEELEHDDVEVVEAAENNNNHDTKTQLLVNFPKQILKYTNELSTMKQASLEREVIPVITVDLLHPVRTKDNWEVDMMSHRSPLFRDVRFYEYLIRWV